MSYLRGFEHDFAKAAYKVEELRESAANAGFP
jgi:hypothetical protein